ncbi:hypothetical protein HHK36_003613 [Tetracentron sinense]|uniref:Disease resistance protein At4g27190-like leucine-rich repeats domain-containing protein n=1 Tax=Tetracentron sinense TaxID=13715 RepID=A0A834ZNK0_TETSI|nr:hypothetical protein HHK36_003613 [Tetracentron sinense]
MEFEPMTAVKDFHSLERLELHGLEELSQIRVEDLQPDTNSSLKVLDVDTCPHLQMINFTGKCQHLEELRIRNCKQWREFSFSDSCNLESLKVMEVDTCHSLSRVFLWPRLQHIEEIKIRNCEHLAELKFWKTSAPESLKVLDVHTCPVLRNVSFPPQLALHHNLEEIKIRNCEQFVGIKMGEYNSRVTLSRLQRLELHGLHNLNSIYSGVLVCDSLRTIDVWGCPRMTRLPLYLGGGNIQPSAPPALKEIKGGKEWWDSLVWDHPEAKTLLQHLFKDVVVPTPSPSQKPISKAARKAGIYFTNFDTQHDVSIAVLQDCHLPAPVPVPVPVKMATQRLTSA